MITPKDQVAMMFGIGVAEQLFEAGLLVRDPDPAPTHLKAGLQYGVNATHWMVRCTYDGITSLSPPNNSHGYTYYYPPTGVDNEVKQWLRDIKHQPHSTVRRYEKIWNKRGTAQRVTTMVNNWGKSWGITAELISVAFVEAA